MAVSELTALLAGTKEGHWDPEAVDRLAVWAPTHKLTAGSGASDVPARIPRELLSALCCTPKPTKHM